MNQSKIGTYLIGFAALTSIVVPIAVDLNESHLFNPEWTGHARLHDAMSFLMSIGLGAAALWLIWNPSRRHGGYLACATLLSIWSWVSLLIAGLFPGATYNNEAEGLSPPVLMGITIWPNAALSWIIIMAGIAGWFLLSRFHRKSTAS